MRNQYDVNTRSAQREYEGTGSVQEIRVEVNVADSSNYHDPISSHAVGPRLWLSFWAIIVGCPFVYGWNIGVTNLPGKYVKCWIQDTINFKNSQNVSNFQNHTQTDIIYTNHTNYEIYSPLNCSRAAEHVNNEEEDEKLIFKDAEKIWALTVGIFGIGAVVSALFGGQFADKFGRKNTMKWNTLLSASACFLQFFSKIVYFKYRVFRSFHEVISGHSYH